MSNVDQFGSLAFKSAMQQLDELLEKKGVSADTRTQIAQCAAIMYEYIPYALAQRKDPTDAKVLAKFLTSKGMKTAALFGNDRVNCGLSIVDFILSANSAYAVSATGFPPAIVTAWGLAMLDLIEVGNSCEFAQMAYYELMIKDSSVRLAPIKVRMNQQFNPANGPSTPMATPLY